MEANKLSIPFVMEILFVLFLMFVYASAFQIAHRNTRCCRRCKTQLSMSYYRSNGKYNQRARNDRSKRQERVGRVVCTELSSIIHGGVIKGDSEHLDADLRQRISVVKADVSPDLRQARVTVSIRSGIEGNSAIEKRRAFSWLVQNTKPIRHTLAQKMSHMKTSPNLSFVQADVGAAVDVMYLIDKVSAGYKRDDISAFDNGHLPEGMVKGLDFDEDSDEDWLDLEDDYDLLEDE